MVAIPWYFTDVVEAPGTFARIYLAVTLVSLFWGVYAGTLVDRYDRKHLMIAEAMAGASIFIPTALVGFQLGGLPAWAVGLMFATTIFIFNIHYPTLYAFAQELVEPKDYSRITSYIEIQGQTSTVLAGGLAAMLLSGVDWSLPAVLQNLVGLERFVIEPWPLHQIFLLDGLTYATAGFVVLFISYQSTKVRQTENDPVFDRLKRGVRFLTNHPMVLLFGAVAPIIFASILTSIFLLNPNYVRNFLLAEAEVFAASEITFAFGSLMAGFFIQRLFSFTNPVMACIILCFGAGLSYLTIAAFHFSWLFLTVVAVLGLCNAGSRILRLTYILDRIPNQVIGRASSVFGVINVLTRLLLTGLFSLAFFVESVPAAYLVLTACCLGGSIVLLLFYRKIIAVPKLSDSLPQPLVPNKPNAASPA